MVVVDERSSLLSVLRVPRLRLRQRRRRRGGAALAAVEDGAQRDHLQLTKDFSAASFGTYENSHWA